MSTKEVDLELWKRWKQTKSPTDASVFVNQMMPLVKNDVYRHSKNIPYPIAEAHAKDLILQAGDKFNPKAGTAIGTYVKSYMPKLNQASATWRSPMKIPESRAYKYSTFKEAFDSLATKLNREPTISELADYLKWSQAEVTRFLNEMRQEFTDDRPFVSNYNPRQSLEEEMIDFIYHDLNSQEKLLLERTTGYGGKPKLSNADIMKRTGWTQNQLSYEKSKLTDKIRRMLGK